MEQRRPLQEPEVLDSRPGGPGRRAWVALAVVCSCLIVVGIAWRSSHQDRNSAEVPPSPSTSAESSSTPDGTVSAGAGEPRTRDVPGVRTTRTADLSWLGAATGYSVFLRTAYGVVRLHPSADEIVRTSVPALASDGPLAFVPVAGGVLIRPIDFVPGYLVPDNAIARELPASGGQLLPGPDDRHVWVESKGGLQLVGVTDSGPGGRVEARIESLSALGTAQQLTGDGHGFILGISYISPVTYRVRPDDLTKIPVQRPIAIGPSRVLGVPAKCSSSCHVTELGPDFKKVAHQPDWTIDVFPYPIGAVSPDGRTAAVVDHRGVAGLINLASGKRTLTQLRAWAPDQLAFSPDGRWLFGIGDDTRAYVIDVRTGRAHRLLGEVTGVRQLAVRAGS